MRFVIIGAGAIGAGVGGLLAEQGSEVVLVARGAHLEAMRAGGLRLLLPDRRVDLAPQVAGSPADVDLTVDDVLVLTTKTPQAADALAAWAAAPVRSRTGDTIGTAGEHLPVLTALNGVAAEEVALRWFSRVYGVCVWMPAVLTAPGEVVVRCAPTRAILHTARYPAALADDGDAAFLAALAQEWGGAGIEVPRPPDVMPWKYRKLLGNLGNAVQALAGPAAADAADVTDAARAEAVALYERAGIVMNSEESEHDSRDTLTVRPVPGAPEAMGGSTWQSLQRGTGSAETDYLNGEIVAIAHRLGTHAPVNAALALLMRTAVERGDRPGAITPDELRRRTVATV